MLKARSAADFATFMTSLCTSLGVAVKTNFGVFDKFTGDGVLAFFPSFYSGDDAGYYALRTAQLAQDIFKDLYCQSRNLFSTVLSDVGLGIGIDYGKVHLIKIAGGLTVVGEPVVYACRLGSAPAGTTLLNQPAFEQISPRYGGFCYISDTELPIKHEGGILCYSGRMAKSAYEPKPPPWLAGAMPPEGGKSEAGS